jgi:hypothetical protein
MPTEEISCFLLKVLKILWKVSFILNVVKSSLACYIKNKENLTFFFHQAHIGTPKFTSVKSSIFHVSLKTNIDSHFFLIQ